MPSWLFGKCALRTALSTQLARPELPPEALALDTPPDALILILTMTVPLPPCFEPHELTRPLTALMPPDTSPRLGRSGRLGSTEPFELEEEELDECLEPPLRQQGLSGSTRQVTSSHPLDASGSAAGFFSGGFSAGLLEVEELDELEELDECLSCLLPLSSFLPTAAPLSATGVGVGVVPPVAGSALGFSPVGGAVASVG